MTFYAAEVTFPIIAISSKILCVVRHFSMNDLPLIMIFLALNKTLINIGEY